MEEDMIEVYIKPHENGQRAYIQLEAAEGTGGTVQAILDTGSAISTIPHELSIMLGIDPVNASGYVDDLKIGFFTTTKKKIIIPIKANITDISMENDPNAIIGMNALLPEARFMISAELVNDNKYKMYSTLRISEEEFDGEIV